MVIEAAPCRFYQFRLPPGRVADCDQHIAEEPVAAGALDRGSGKHFAECGIVEYRQLGQPRRRQLRARQKVGLGRGSGEFVPRADRQTIVAAIDPITDQRAQL